LDIDFVAINDLTNPETLAHLLEYDSIHGILSDDITVTDDGLVVNGKEIRVLAERDPDEAADLWVLLRGALSLREAAAAAAASEDPQVLARWAYEGAQRFNAFYHRYRIAGEPDAAARSLRTYGVETFFAQHRRGLALLGIPVPGRM